MLRDLHIKAVYRSDHDNILEDFYIPALSSSITYDRAVGYFSASMLSYAAQGLSAFVHNDGRMRLIVGGELDPEDVIAIQDGYDLRRIVERLNDQIVQAIERIDDSLFYRRFEILSWLVACGRLDIKIALKQRGMYHEKIGILGDSEGNRIVFQGSANETTHALLPDFNFESINVFQCWRSEFKDHFMPYIVGFEDLWQNNSPGTLVLDFPDAARDKLVKVAKRTRHVMAPLIEIELWNKYKERDSAPEAGVEPRIPPTLNGEEFSIRPHQIKALEAWKAHDLRGILALATGSGKTITAIYGALKIYETAKRLFLVIAVPYQNLADQWVDVLRKFDITPIQCYESAADWLPTLRDCLTLYQTGAMKFVCLVVVNRTLQSEQFQQCIDQVPGENFLFVGDECHHHASLVLSDSLPQQAKLRLGLSATPEHYIDDSATLRLTDFYGPVVATYDLEQALRDGVLTPYKYHVVLVDLTEEEAQEYGELSVQISKLAAMNNSSDLESSSDEQLKLLLFRRARVLGRAKNKRNELEKQLTGSKSSPLTLFYCGDGSTDDEDSGEPIRQVEAVSSLLYKLGWRSSIFTAREKRQARQILLDHFRLGLIDALVAIRCLDEGIDVPGCRMAYILASSKNPKQFIQRRGRILRRSPGKEYAEIFDFVVKFPETFIEGNPYERQLIRSELERVAEFARLASNSADAVRELSPLLIQYDLSHLLV